MTKTHLEAIAALGFVHERLPAGDKNNGRYFVQAIDFDSNAPSVRVVIDADDYTELFVFVGWEMLYSIRFDYAVPAMVVNQAISAATNVVR